MINLVQYSRALWHHITVSCKYFGVSESSVPWIPQILQDKSGFPSLVKGASPDSWSPLSVPPCALVPRSLRREDTETRVREEKKIRQPLMFKKTILIVSATLWRCSCCDFLPCFPHQRGLGGNWLDIIWWKEHDYSQATLEGGVKMKWGFSKAMILLIICPVSLRFALL